MIKANLLLIANGTYNNLIFGFFFKGNNITKLPKFDLEINHNVNLSNPNLTNLSSSNLEKLKIKPNDLVITRMFFLIYFILFNYLFFHYLFSILFI